MPELGACCEQLENWQAVQFRDLSNLPGGMSPHGKLVPHQITHSHRIQGVQKHWFPVAHSDGKSIEQTCSDRLQRLPRDLQKRASEPPPETCSVGAEHLDYRLSLNKLAGIMQQLLDLLGIGANHADGGWGWGRAVAPTEPQTIVTSAS